VTEDLCPLRLILPGASAPADWGDPNVVRQRLGNEVRDIEFDRDEMVILTLSPKHFRAYFGTFGGTRHQGY
jgi:hypothetical protein